MEAPRRKAIFMAAGAVVSAAMLAAALWLGSWAFHTRQRSLHEGRLSRALAMHPTADRLTKGLEDEGSPLLASARGAAEVEVFAARWGGQRRQEILAKARLHASTRIHRSQGAVYFLYFDAEDVLRDYTCIE